MFSYWLTHVGKKKRNREGAPCSQIWSPSHHSRRTWHVLSAVPVSGMRWTAATRHLHQSCSILMLHLILHGAETPLRCLPCGRPAIFGLTPSRRASRTQTPGARNVGEQDFSSLALSCPTVHHTRRVVPAIPARLVCESDVGFPSNGDAIPISMSNPDTVTYLSPHTKINLAAGRGQNCFDQSWITRSGAQRAAAILATTCPTTLRY